MGEKDIGIEDVFCQWARFTGTLDAANEVLPIEVEIPTGLALFGDRAWAIHAVEFDSRKIMGEALLDAATATSGWAHFQMSIGRPGLVGVGQHDIDGDGIICAKAWTGVGSITTEGSGLTVFDTIKTWKPPTPVPYARNRISLYARFDADVARTGIRSEDFMARVYYTYIPTTPELYREMAERWAL